MSSQSHLHYSFNRECLQTHRQPTYPSPTGGWPDRPSHKVSGRRIWQKMKTSLQHLAKQTWSHNWPWIKASQKPVGLRPSWKRPHVTILCLYLLFFAIQIQNPPYCREKACISSKTDLDSHQVQQNSVRETIHSYSNFNNDVCESIKALIYLFLLFIQQYPFRTMIYVYASLFIP